MSSIPRLAFSSPSSSSASSSPSSGLAGSRSRALVGAVALAVALLTATLAPGAHAARAAKIRIATVTITNVTVKSTATDAELTVTGRVKLPANTTKQRRRTEVYLTLIGGPGTSEAFTAKLTSKDTFTATHTTKLTGALGLDTIVKIAGKQSGKKIVRTVSVTVSP